jgi:NADH-quinone oxidoreductase subunit G
MPTLEIDGQTVTVEDGTNLIQAAAAIGNEVPHYCYHPGLTVAGNCRMCLVEIEKMPKLQIACNTKATEGMVVHTKSEKVLRARESVLEFLLVNHPVDCPICDQAGECKLQDYYMEHDRQESRVPLQAKVHKGKAIDIGPLIMLDQERCILCTRCTRFLDEVTGTGELGVFQRGDHCEIDVFPGIELDNAYSGNVADICPVGALTNKDFRFRARVWYLQNTQSVCATCATGCNIDVHHRRDEIFRFRPRFNADVNSYWMCDEGRLSYRKYQGEGRLLQPVKRGQGDWQPIDRKQCASELDALLTEADGVVGGIVSAHSTNEEIFLFRKLIADKHEGRVAGHSWSPSDATRDDFLIDADKTPNTAGLRAQGLEPSGGRALVESALAGEIAVMVLFRTDLSEICSAEEMDKLGDLLQTIVVLDTHYGPSVEIADLVVPIAAFTETDGSFVNRAARVQRIRRAVAPAGNSEPGWQVLGGLLGEGSPGDSAATAFAALGASQDAFAGLSFDGLGQGGAPLAGAAGGASA